MKKPYYLLITLAIAFASKAQTNQGSLLIGLSSNLNLGGSGPNGAFYSSSRSYSDSPFHQSNEPTKQYGFNLSPKIGVFLVENLALGLSTRFSYTRYESGNNTFSNQSTLYNFGSFIRYYIPISRQNLLYLESAVAWGQRKNEYEYSDPDLGNQEVFTNSFSGTFSSGISFALSDYAYLDLGLGYNYQQTWNPEFLENNQYRESHALILDLGLTFLLENRRY
jgi:hypothetical protein